jgi:hypothetical protein
MADIDKLAGPDGGDEGLRLAKFWLGQIDKVKDDPRQKRWIKRGQTIEKRYRDERTRVDGEDGNKRYNALWANVQILTPAIYGKCPTPIAERRFRDKDPTGRAAAQILERALRNEVEINGFHDAIVHAVSDYLLPGRGVVWVRYEPEIEEGISVVTEGYLDVKDDEGSIEPEDAGKERLRLNPDQAAEPGEETEATQAEAEADDEAFDDDEEEKLRDTGDRIVRESCPVDYINWEDFMTFPHNARIWKEVTAVCKKVYMTRDQLKTRFGKEIGGKITMRKDNRITSGYDGPDMNPEDKAIVYEIWSLTTKEVLWIAEGYEYLCDRKDDPLRLEHFFPVPRPLFANTTNGTLYPVADYIEYQDQAIQIDELTQRISMLSKACKVAGVYNAAAKDIQRLMQESVENELIPVDDWAAFAEKGGIAGNISFIPLKEIMGVLNELMQIKDKQIQEMDRLTGINDIMRGTTDARETLGAQRIKTNSSGTRLERRQNEVARFCRDVIRIIADIMSQHFSDQSMVEASGAMYEEGLGQVDFASASETQEIMQQLLGPQGMQPQLPGPPQQLALPPPTPPAGGVPPMGGSPMPVPAPGGMPGAPGGGLPPQGPPPMGLPGQPPTPALPGGIGQPPMMAGGPPGMQTPQLPPELVKQLVGMKRIKDGLGLIRNEKLRGFRVDIEVDSTIYGDSNQEKSDRTQFLTAVTGYLQQTMAMAAQVPEIAPLLGKLLQFGVRGFKVGRDLEASIEDFCDEATALAKQKQQQAQQAAQNSPQAITAQASMVKAKAADKAVDAKAGTDKAKLASDVQRDQTKAQSEARKDQAEVQRQAIENQGEQANKVMEMHQQQQEQAGDERKAAADMQLKNMDMEMKKMQMQFERMKMMYETIKMSREAMQPMADVAKEG